MSLVKGGVGVETDWTPCWRLTKVFAMAALISHTSFDSFNAHASSVFWGEVLGFAEDPDDPNEPGDEECMIFSADGIHRLLFIEVPDAKQVKKRMHLDLKPAERTRKQELERLLGLGAPPDRRPTPPGRVGMDRARRSRR